MAATNFSAAIRPFSKRNGLASGRDPAVGARPCCRKRPTCFLTRARQEPAPRGQPADTDGAVFRIDQFQRLFSAVANPEPEWMMPAKPRPCVRSSEQPFCRMQYDCVSQAMHFEATAKLAGDILVKVDRMSMANSIEVRCPLLDHPLAEMANRIPNRWKMKMAGENKYC